MIINADSLYPGLILRECGYFLWCLVSYRRPSCLQQTLDGFFSAELIAAILVLFGAYQVLDA